MFGKSDKIKEVTISTNDEYVIWNEDGGHGAVIDCGNHVLGIKKFVQDNGIVIDYIILTHGHHHYVKNGTAALKRLAKEQGADTLPIFLLSHLQNLEDYMKLNFHSI